MRQSYKERSNGIEIANFTITYREILSSFSIIAVMLLIGFLISNRIAENQMDKNEIYNKAIKIESKDMFEYGMRTNVGNAFVYGDLKAIDTVTYPEIGGQYMYVRKEKEIYTMHTRTVTKTRTVNGKSQTYTEIETYWTWDVVDIEKKKCEEISFLGVNFKSNKINTPSSHYIDTIYESSHVRYKYYGTDIEHLGTIFVELKDDTISDGTNFYSNMNIEETLEYFQTDFGSAAFWIFWVALICGCVYGFYYLDNVWLE